MAVMADRGKQFSSVCYAALVEKVHVQALTVTEKGGVEPCGHRSRAGSRFDRRSVTRGNATQTVAERS